MSPPRSDLYARFYKVVRRVPAGRVATYGQIARLAGLPRYSRHVGYALHALPPGSDVPWHRVINARGGISPRRESGPDQTQRLRLEREGVILNAAGVVALSIYGWVA
ncbi:MAG TPA: MGMT family protein [Gammaproteobacteria bacterium]|nr:MGMT family protein [Gammaproteobacteria bacterium]